MSCYNSELKAFKIMARTSRRKHIASIKHLLLLKSRSGKGSGLLFRAAVVMVTATVVGTNISAIARITGYSRSFLRTIAQRMHASKLWVNGQARVDHWPDTHSEFLPIFYADILVAYGDLVRMPKEGGTLVYQRSGAVRQNETRDG